MNSALVSIQVIFSLELQAALLTFVRIIRIVILLQVIVQVLLTDKLQSADGAPELIRVYVLHSSVLV